MGGQTFVQSMPDEPFFLYGDVTRLVQVISNFLNKATKYIGPTDTILLTAEKSSTEAVITVSDNGQGISADLLPNIFEMFTHVLAGEAKPMSGLGIGLTLAKRMVEMHDGRLLAHSAGVGQGSTFTIHLPLLLGFTPKSVPDSPAEEIDEQTAVCRILIVDDNRDVADGLAEYLQMMGHEVHSTYDGLKAIAMAKTLQPDIMLLDIGMSDMDGYEVAKRIRQHSWSKNIFLIAHTGWGQEDDKKRVQEAGFDHHIVKPIRPGELKDLMSQLAKRKLANS
jgi:CheY-like chemotaxis protein